MNIENEYRKRFGDEYVLSTAPGRINIIGEHTDYNNGFVLPASIDRKVSCAIGSNPNSDSIDAYAIDLDETASVNPMDLNLQTKPDWLRYIAGVSRVLLDKGRKPGGFHIVFSSDIPLGAGLSSSAAIEAAVATGLNHLFDLNLDKEEIALTGQMAEHKYVGVNCGIMDQYASVFGLAGQAILLDCLSLEKKYIPINLKDYSFILCNSGVKHSLASSEYNTRRKECEEGVAAINKHHPGVSSLRDVTMEMLNEMKTDMTPIIWNRCMFVVEENQRVLETCKNLENNHIEKVGEYLYKSHQGLSWLYEVSCEELDFLVESTKNMEFVPGARMMGGGFGGCTINIVHSDFKGAFINEISNLYTSRFGIDLECFSMKISGGACII